MTSTVPMSIRIDQSLKDRLNKLASITKRSAHALATQAVEQLVVEQEKLLAWNESCVDSFSEFKESGLHVTQTEIEQWMDSWGADKELTPPKCHL